MNDECGFIPRNEFRELIAGELSGERREELREHITDCVTCQSRVLQAENQTRSLRLDVTRDLSESTWTANETPSPIHVRPTEFPQIDDYQILRELGHGGMGAVYLARQKSVDRLVALKLLSPSPQGPNHAAPEQLTERFRAEIQATARIENDFVVPVYQVGKTASARFFTMQYVEGPTLLGLIGKRLTIQQAAKYVAQAARGIHAAHEQKILHRDVKPHNILIASANDRAMVTDFGLAKLQNADTQITADRSVFGTVAYMSPEQTHDSSQVTALSDIYSLGATLYHCLTGRPPFHASGIPEVIRQVNMEEPVPPSQLNGQLPGDLEAICMKCLEKKSDLRYKSALLLAQDLERFIEGKPTVARPLTPIATFFRWCRRNRTVAALAFTAAAFLLATTLVSFAAYRKISRQNQTLANALDNELKANEKASAALKKGMESVVQFSLTVADSPVLQRSQLNTQRFRRQLLNDARDYLDEFAAIQNVDGIQEKSIEALIDSASLSRQLGEPDKARNSLDQAGIRIEKLPETPQKKPLEFLLARQTGQLNKTLGKSEQALTELKKSKDLVSQILKDEPNNTARKRDVLETTRLYAEVLGELGQYEQARDALNEAIVEAKSIRRETGSIQDAVLLASLLDNLGSVENRLGHPKGLAGWKGAADVFESIDLSKLTPQQTSKYAASLMHTAIALKSTDQMGALEYRKRSVKVFEELTRRNPDVGKFECGYIKSASNVAYAYLRLKNLDGVEEIVNRIEPRIKRLMQDSPDYADYKHAYALVLDKKLMLSYERKEFEESFAVCAEEVQVCKELLTMDANNGSYAETLGNSMRNLAEMSMLTNRHAKALEVLNEVFTSTWNTRNFRQATYGSYNEAFTKIVEAREANSIDDKQWNRCKQLASVHLGKLGDDDANARIHWFLSEYWRLEGQPERQKSELEKAVSQTKSDRDQFLMALDALGAQSREK